MNILTINANDNSLGGASRIAMDIHSGLIKSGIASNVFVGKKTSNNDSVKEIPRTKFRRLAAKIFANDFEFYLSDKIFKEKEYISADIVHCHNLNGWYFNLSTLQKISKEKKVVWTLHDMWPLNPHSGYTSSKTLVNNLLTVSDQNLYPTMWFNNDKYLARKKDKIYQSLDVRLVSPSNWLLELTKLTSLGKNPISVIPNGIDVDVFTISPDKSSAKESLGLGGKVVILFVGTTATTNTFKGFDHFLWLSKQKSNQNYIFVCVGASKDYIDGNMLYVKATSDKKKLAQFYSCADVFILTSGFENFPLVVLESLSCGTPVISYDVGGVSEILHGINGCSIVEKGDKEALSLSLKNTLEKNKILDRDNLALNLRRVVLDKYNNRKMVDRYIALYISMLG